MRQPRKVAPPSPHPFDPPHGSAEAIWRDLNALPASLVPDLPLPVSLWLRVEGAPAEIQLTTAPASHASSSLSELIVFEREELRALVCAAEADRLFRRELLGLCFEKWRRPDYRVTLADALAGANPDPQGWSLAQVLSRMGATLERVELAPCPDALQPLSEAA